MTPTARIVHTSHRNVLDAERLERYEVTSRSRGVEIVAAAFNKSNRPQPVNKSAEHATVALDRAIDHELGDRLKCCLAEFLVLQFIQRVERAYRRFTTWAGALNTDFQIFQTEIQRGSTGGFSCYLGGKRCAFT